jgi:Histidine kinase
MSITTSTLASAALPNLARLFVWRRLVYTLGASLLWALLLTPIWQSGTPSLILRTGVVGLAAMLIFGVLEQWPAKLPAWFARWVLQVLGVALVVPSVIFVIYVLSTQAGQPPFWKEPLRLSGFALLSITGLLFAPWVALSALLRQREAFISHQALAFELERSELNRQALDARLHLLQAQVQPHFLFNTLANVQALVDAGSPRASAVLGSLTNYLRAAVPRLNEPATTLGQELELVRAYLELMHMRMPDRLQFALQVDDAALPLRCPPMTLLTLVENAVRHGIDPSEVGGRIDIHVALHDDRCRVRVCDSGVGLQATGSSLGTGLSTLQERLKLAFGGHAQLRLSALQPSGVCAELEFPA